MKEWDYDEPDFTEEDRIAERDAELAADEEH